MSNHKPLVERILEIVRCELQYDLEELILSCGDFPWQEVWREIAHLQRAGTITILSSGSEYIVLLSSQLPATETVPLGRPRLRCRPRTRAPTVQASLRHNRWALACQP